MRPEKQTTLRKQPLPAVVVVSASAGAVEACRRAAYTLGPVVVEPADVGNVATVAARLIPFALVVDEDLFSFDPEEWNALARDVGAAVICVPEPDLEVDALTARVSRAVRVAFSKRWG